MKELHFFLSPSTVCLCFFVCFFEGVGSGVGRAQASKASPNVVCTVGVLPAFSHISGPYFPGGFLSILLAPPHLAIPSACHMLRPQLHRVGRPQERFSLVPPTTLGPLIICRHHALCFSLIHSTNIY